MTLTESAYAAAIPPWCAYRTLEQHKAMGLCWGLVRDVERGVATSEATCRPCPLYKPSTSSGSPS